MVRSSKIRDLQHWGRMFEKSWLEYNLVGSLEENPLAVKLLENRLYIQLYIQAEKVETIPCLSEMGLGIRERTYKNDYLFRMNL